DDGGRRVFAANALGGLETARCGQRQVHQDDVWRGHARHLEPGTSVGGLADHVEVAFAAQDVRDAHAEEGVVVDDQDPDPVGGYPAAASLAALSLGRHQLSSPASPGIGMPIAPGGIVIRTAVPRFGEDRTSKRAPMSSARSRMNCRPKCRRPLTGGSSLLKPRPSSRTSSPQPPWSCHILIRMELGWACLRAFWSASWITRRATTSTVSGRASTLASISTSTGMLSAEPIWLAASWIAPVSPRSARSGGRSWLM